MGVRTRISGGGASGAVLRDPQGRSFTVDKTALVEAVDDQGRKITLGGRNGLLIQSADGTAIHDTPDADLIAGSYRMGQLYLHKFDNAAYTLLNISGFSLNTWIPASIVKSGISNIKGVRIGIRFFVLDSSVAVTFEAYVSARPAGSDWNGSIADMAPRIDTGFMAAGSAGVGGDGAIVGGVLDVPLGGSGNIEVYASATGGALTRTLFVQQLGIWV